MAHPSSKHCKVKFGVRTGNDSSTSIFPELENTDVDDIDDDDNEDDAFDNLDQSWEKSGVDVDAVFGTSATEVFKKRKRRKTSRKSALDLTPELKEKIFQANYLSAQGEKAEAIKLLLEVLAENFRLYDVYESIARLYDEIGNPVLSLKYEALATVNLPKNSLGHKDSGGRWLQVSKKSFEVTNIFKV
jgi:tetratricopeptide (TPR) repeat protein